MIQAHNQISHFHALRSASGMDQIPTGERKRLPLMAHLNPLNPQLLKLISLRVLSPNAHNLLEPGHRNQSQRKYLRNAQRSILCYFSPLFVTEVCFCFRLMLRLGDRVCTRACVLVQFCMSAWRYWKAEDCYESLWHAVYKRRHFLNVRQGFLHVQAFLSLFSINGSSGRHMAPHALLHFPSTIHLFEWYNPGIS